jgi:hypothetical protein
VSLERSLAYKKAETASKRLSGCRRRSEKSEDAKTLPWFCVSGWNQANAFVFIDACSAFLQTSPLLPLPKLHNFAFDQILGFGLRN